MLNAYISTNCLLASALHAAVTETLQQHRHQQPYSFYLFSTNDSFYQSELLVKPGMKANSSTAVASFR
jgi:hypothetical protein